MNGNVCRSFQWCFMEATISVLAFKLEKRVSPRNGRTRPRRREKLSKSLKTLWMRTASTKSLEEVWLGACFFPPLWRRQKFPTKKLQIYFGPFLLAVPQEETSRSMWRRCCALSRLMLRSLLMVATKMASSTPWRKMILLGLPDGNARYVMKASILKVTDIKQLWRLHAISGLDIRLYGRKALRQKSLGAIVKGFLPVWDSNKRLGREGLFSLSLLQDGDAQHYWQLEAQSAADQYQYCQQVKASSIGMLKRSPAHHGAAVYLGVKKDSQGFLWEAYSVTFSRACSRTISRFSCS